MIEANTQNADERLYLDGPSSTRRRSKPLPVAARPADWTAAAAAAHDARTVGALISRAEGSARNTPTPLCAKHPAAATMRD